MKNKKQVTDRVLTRRFLSYLRNNKITYSYEFGILTLGHAVGHIVGNYWYIHFPALSHSKGISVSLNISLYDCHRAYLRYMELSAPFIALIDVSPVTPTIPILIEIQKASNYEKQIV